MTMLRQHIASREVDTKEKALAAFWRLHKEYNGNRRASPEEFIEVRQVRQSERGAWDIYYEVPARVVREAHERRS